MDTSKYIIKCPQCGAEIEPERCASTGDKVLGGVTGISGAAIGFGLGGPVGALIGAGIGYFAGKKTVMSIEDDHDTNHWFKYKCPNCSYERKEKIQSNDDPDDPSWIGNAPY
jgi:predicted RNA-binding Zn-ribbon protein involved in translation (DUF1610 family)